MRTGRGVIQEENDLIRLSLQGNVLEVPVDAALTWAIGTMISPLELVAGVHWIEHYGMPPAPAREFLRVLEGTISQLEENASVVDDPSLHQAITSVLPALRTFTREAARILAWQETQVPKESRSAHQRASEEAGPLEPPWQDRPDFQALEQSSSLAYSAYLDNLEHTIPLLTTLLEPSAPSSLSDHFERAKEKIHQSRIILELGYTEAIRRSAGTPPEYPSG